MEGYVQVALRASNNMAKHWICAEFLLMEG